MERSIHIFPNFRDMDEIEKIRKKYDDLYGLIGPHITLVFPFESEIKTSELVKHLKQQCLMKPFDISLGQLIVEDTYLFLTIDQGHENIKLLNQALYSGILAPFKAPIEFIPHITIGRFKSKSDAKNAFANICLENVFECSVNQISIEIIQEDGKSLIEHHHSLD